MSETLVLRMPEGDRSAAWLVVDAFGNRMGQAQSGSLAEAASFAAGRRLRVCVPGADVSLLHADLPTHNSRKILQAVPFALEDRLADEVENLHFAVGTHGISGYPVAIVTRARMQQWLSDLASAGLTPMEMVPETLSLPVREHTLVVVPDEQQWLARFPDGMGLSANHELMPLLIKRHLATLPETLRCTHALIYTADEGAQQDAAAMLADTGLEVAYSHTNAGSIGLMASSVHSAQTINLLQGDFSRRAAAGERWLRWRVATLLLTALIVIFIVQQGVSEFRFRHEIHVLNTQISTLFHQALPDITRMVDPQAQMQQRLKQLTGGGGNAAGVLPMLAVIGRTLQAQSGAQLQGFSYHGGELQLQIQAGSIETLNDLKSALAQDASLQVQLDSVNSSGGQTTGRLTLRGSGT